MVRYGHQVGGPVQAHIADLNDVLDGRQTTDGLEMMLAIDAAYYPNTYQALFQFSKFNCFYLYTFSVSPYLFLTLMFYLLSL